MREANDEDILRGNKLRCGRRVVLRIRSSRGRSSKGPFEAGSHGVRPPMRTIGQSFSKQKSVQSSSE